MFYASDNQIIIFYLLNLLKCNFKLNLIMKNNTDYQMSNRFQALLDCAEIMFVEIDIKGIVTLVNHKTCKVLGYNEDEILGKNWFENFLPERIKKEILPISKKLLKGEIETAEFYENPILTKNNEERIIYWHNSVIKDDEGKIIRHLSSGEDITERKKIETALEINVEKFRTIADYTYDWEYWIDINNEFIYVSPSCSRITGYKPQDFYEDKQLLDKIIHPDDLNYFMHHKHSVNKEGHRTPIDFRIITKNGEIHWVGHVCQDVYDSSGILKGIRGSNRLITEQKHNEQHIKMLSNIVEQHPASIIITNLKGEIEYVNKSFTDITGYTFNMVKGKNSRILSSEKNDPQTYTNLWKTISKGRIWKGEFINKRKSGEEYFEKAIISPTFDEKGNVVNYFSISEDVTLQKKAKQLLQESKNKLKVANATKDKFFSIIAHDLRSPFNAIIGFSELLLEHHKEYSEEKREYIIKLIAESSKNTFELLETLLEWSRTQSGAIKFDPSQFILEKIIKESIEQVEGSAAQKNISISYSVESAIILNADEEMVKTILRNLISNAIKFTSRSGKIKIVGTKSNDDIIVSVIDNGVGIKKDKIESLFTITNTETTVGTENEKGHGLGLILCKELVDKHGGEIFVKSTEKVGSTFSFAIPN